MQQELWTAVGQSGTRALVRSPQAKYIFYRPAAFPFALPTVSNVAYNFTL